jgi:hypothetical protein
MAWAIKRRFPRFEPEDMTFAVLHNETCTIGQIVSVSRGGLAFEYAPFSEFEDSDPGAAGPSLDIIVGQAPLYVARIPCRVLYDFKVRPEGLLADGIARRCCGLTFDHPTDEQKAAVEILISRYVCGPAREDGS